MNDLKKGISMDFTKTHFPEGIHMCLIYDRDEDRQKIVSEYMAAGLRQGEQIRYLTDATTLQVVHSWLLEMGVELPEAEENSPLKVLSAESAYYPNGHFNPRELMPTLSPRYKLAKKAGYAGQRSCGEITWVLKLHPWMIVRGKIVQDPYYISPQEFLDELNLRQ